nr:hypothetical protein [Tanacetum cinerariifolium]
MVLANETVKIFKNPEALFLNILRFKTRIQNIERQLVNPVYTTAIEPSASNITNRKRKYTASCSRNLPAYCRPVMIDRVIPHEFLTYEVIQQSDVVDDTNWSIDLNPKEPHHQGSFITDFEPASFDSRTRKRKNRLLQQFQLAKTFKQREMCIVRA